MILFCLLFKDLRIPTWSESFCVSEGSHLANHRGMLGADIEWTCYKAQTFAHNCMHLWHLLEWNTNLFNSLPLSHIHTNDGFFSILTLWRSKISLFPSLPGVSKLTVFLWNETHERVLLIIFSIEKVSMVDYYIKYS